MPAQPMPGAWTQGKPIKNGYYWYFGKQGYEDEGPVAVYVYWSCNPYRLIVQFPGTEETGTVDELSGWWDGPIDRPENPS